MSTENDSKLPYKVRSYLRLHHYSVHTEKTYGEWIKKYVHFHRMKSMADMENGEKKIESFLTFLAMKKNVAPATHNQAMNALVFLYKKVLLRLSVSIFIMLITSPAWAALHLTLPSKAFQGDMVVGRVVPYSGVWSGGKALTVSPDGYFVIGLARDLKNDIVVLAKNDEKQVKRTIRVIARSWQVESIKGLPIKKVSPDPETLRRIKEDNRKVSVVRSAPHSSDALFVDKGFTMPVKGRLSGVFGSQRILNGKPRSPHRGLDIAAPMETPVMSPADGIVRLTAKDMVLMGNTLIVDHGLGVRSIFIHLNRIMVNEGDAVSKGDVIARVGKSGRTTGPHLHWGVFVGTVAVDPQKVLNQ